jgi:hypothetical protein
MPQLYLTPFISNPHTISPREALPWPIRICEQLSKAYTFSTLWFFCYTDPLKLISGPQRKHWRLGKTAYWTGSKFTLHQYLDNKKSCSMKWAGNVVCMEEKSMQRVGRKPEGKGPLRRPKWGQENIKMDNKYDGSVWTGFIWLTTGTSSGLHVNTVTNICVL